MLAERGMMRHIGAMPAPAIEVKDLVKRYPSAVALDGISFAVAPDVIAALRGGVAGDRALTITRSLRWACR
jgi:hypothetical protein